MIKQRPRSWDADNGITTGKGSRRGSPATHLHSDVAPPMLRHLVVLVIVHKYPCQQCKNGACMQLYNVGTGGGR